MFGAMASKVKTKRGAVKFAFLVPEAGFFIDYGIKCQRTSTENFRVVAIDLNALKSLASALDLNEELESQCGEPCWSSD